MCPVVGAMARYWGCVVAWRQGAATLVFFTLAVTTRIQPKIYTFYFVLIVCCSPTLLFAHGPFSSYQRLRAQPLIRGNAPPLPLRIIAAASGAQSSPFLSATSHLAVLVCISFPHRYKIQG